MRSLVLVSSSQVHGHGYLDTAEEAIRALFAGRRVLFVPFALFDHDAYAGRVRNRFASMDLVVESLHATRDAHAAVGAAEGVFVGGGNTFRLLRTLQDLGLLDLLRRRVLSGLPYLGSSAGSNLACPTIKTTNDMPIVEVRDFTALGLVPFQINPHYLDPDPESRHRGETREARILEFLEMNATPVLGLREGAHLVVRGDAMTLQGVSGARLFRRRSEAVEWTPGADLSFLLEGTA
jgi:dipeptidase E